MIPMVFGRCFGDGPFPVGGGVERQEGAQRLLFCMLRRKGRAPQQAEGPVAEGASPAKQIRQELREEPATRGGGVEETWEGG